jgi:hypothetical protein
VITFAHVAVVLISFFFFLLFFLTQYSSPVRFNFVTVGVCLDGHQHCTMMRSPEAMMRAARSVKARRRECADAQSPEP